MANGVDLYTKYQTVTDWAAVRGAGIEFAYVKAADGLDPKDTGGWGVKGRRAGVKMGAYLYAQPGTPVSQANLLCDQAFMQGLSDLAPALDIESNAAIHTWGTQEAIDFSIAFLTQVKARGYRPCLYANNSMLYGVNTAILPAVKAAVPDVVVWAARYGGLVPGGAYDVWQHSSAGRVPGIGNTVDLNVGPIPLNTTGGTVPAVDQKEDDMPDRELLPTDGARTRSVTLPVPKSAAEVVVSLGWVSMFVTKLAVYGPSPATGTDTLYVEDYAAAPKRIDGGRPWQIALAAARAKGDAVTVELTYSLAPASADKPDTRATIGFR